MRIAYVDCFAGVSGDMLLGGLVDLGVPLPSLQRELNALPLSGYSLRAERVSRASLTATRVTVDVSEPGARERHLPAILRLIEDSGLPDLVRVQSARAFQYLAEAEGRLHGVSPEEVHFHEIGAIDAIVDIVGVCLGFHFLAVEEIAVSPLPAGSGTISCQHGLLPVPAPAVLALLGGFPFVPGPGPGELVTPTGAALVKTLAARAGPLPPMTLAGVGYGAGTRDPAYPNVLRIVLGDRPGTVDGTPTAGLEVDTVAILEASIDDMNPQAYDYIMGRLFDRGALDINLAPVQMKKNRPGTLVTVLSPPDRAPDLAQILLTESTTFGIRVREQQRWKLPREIITVNTPYGPIRIKQGRLGQAGSVVQRSPEYEDCRRAAQEHGVPLAEVFRAAQAVAREARSPERQGD